MPMPHADAAIVAEEKIVGYLLNPSHPDGAGKAWFFDRVGFHSDQWQVLARALHELAAHSDITSQVVSVHGTKYIVDGLIDTPCGRIIGVRTIWIIDAGDEIPRLVTAYPRSQEM